MSPRGVVGEWIQSDTTLPEWEERRLRILDCLQGMDADILALQEALPRDLDDSLDKDLNAMGFQALHRSEDVDGIEPPVLYVHTASFRVVWDDCHQRTVGAVLCPRTFHGPPICVLNVHLVGSPDQGEARKGQIRKALQRAKNEFPNFAHDDCSIPCILLGDFNEGPDDGALYQLLTQDGLEVSGETWHFADAYDTALGSKAPPTCECPSPTRRIDFIFTTDEIKCVGVPAPLVCEDDDYPSDHLLIAADLRLSEGEDELVFDSEEDA